jgi:hypothetical protein
VVSTRGQSSRTTVDHRGLARTLRLSARPCSPLTRKVSSKVNPAGKNCTNPEEGGRAYLSPLVLPPLRSASWVISPSEPLIQLGFGDRQKAITPPFGRPRRRRRTRHRLHRWLRKSLRLKRAPPQDFRIDDVSSARQADVTRLTSNAIEFSDHTTAGGIDSETALMPFAAGRAVIRPRRSFSRYSRAMSNR